LNVLENSVPQRLVDLFVVEKDQQFGQILGHRKVEFAHEVHELTLAFQPAEQGYLVHLLLHLELFALGHHVLQQNSVRLDVGPERE